MMLLARNFECTRLGKRQKVWRSTSSSIVSAISWFHEPSNRLLPLRFMCSNTVPSAIRGICLILVATRSTTATEWRDTHLGLRGPVAAELAMSFIAFWNRFCPAHERITHRYHRSVDSHIVAGQNEAMRLSFPIRDLYIAAIDQAEQFILLTTAYFVPDRMLLEALQAATRRGVDVRVLIPWVSNHVLADWVAHSYFTDCLQGGVRIFGYRYTMLHAKTCTIDGQWSTVGTCNLDRLSLVGNYEINVAVYSAEFARQMFALFAEDTAEKFELTMEQWKSRPWYNKVSERILAPLRFLM